MQLALPFFDLPGTRRPRRRPARTLADRIPASAVVDATGPAGTDGINARILDGTRRLAERAAQIFGTDLSAWSVHCDLRGTNAGQVQIHRQRIRFNPWMAAAQPEAFMQTTIPHELAHVVCHLLHGRRARPHGREWREICVALGGDGLRCHGFDAAPARRLRQFLYACGCRTWSISSVRVRRMRRGTRYHCRACGGVLQPAEK
jgi:SprT protein